VADKPAIGALIRLSDTNETIAGTYADIRGHKVVDTEGTELGKVEALFIDREAHKVRLMEISSGGFLGIGQDLVIMPIDVVDHLDEGVVHINQTKDRVTGAPAYDPDLVDIHAKFEETYGYFGYPPYW